MDKATRIDLFSMRSAPMRAFHLTWMAFFVCFFAIWEKSGKTILFMTLDNVRFRRAVRPGDTLRMKVVVTKHRSTIFKFAGQAFVEGVLAASRNAVP